MANEQLAFSGDFAGHFTDLETPVPTDRSFSIEPGGDFATIYAGGRDWYLTPVDRRTHIPYPILQHEPLPRYNPLVTNVHHARHPGALHNVQDSLLPDDPGPLSRLAERNAQLQLVRATDHNRIDQRSGRPTYHDYFYGTIPLRSEAEIFKYVISCVAGILPKYAIDMRPGEPRIVVPTEEQRALMRMVRKPAAPDWKRQEKKKCVAGADYLKEYGDVSDPDVDQETYVAGRLADYVATYEAGAGFAFVNFGYRYDVIRHFISDYVMSQNINVSEAEIDRFLEEEGADRKYRLGENLLRLAVDAATLDISPTYSQAKKHGAIHPRQAQSSQEIVWKLLVTPSRRSKVVEQYSETLKRQRAIAA